MELRSSIPWGWLTTDPPTGGRYYSPYLGMGNNPINGVDPDGGWLYFSMAGKFGEDIQNLIVKDLQGVGWDKLIKNL